MIDPTSVPVCDDTQQRRADVLAHPTLNGIDYVEVEAADHSRLHLFFLKPVPPADAGDPADTDDAWGLAANPDRIAIAGGRRIVGLETLSVERQPDGHLLVVLSGGGDYSIYTLTITVPQLDPFLRRIDLDFMATCPVDVDCKQQADCPPKTFDEPLIDYLAKDYASFRRLLLDLLPGLNPDFVERNPSDFGIALVELLAYTGDHLSYFQDAVANEGFLDTVRHRISARRHARLVDYRMHDGRNAWTWVHLQVQAAGTLPVGSKVTTRLFEPLAGTTTPPQVVVDDFRVTAASLESDPALRGAVVFETSHAAAFDPRNNSIFIHTWGNEECCLGAATRELYLYTVNGATGTAERPQLSRGDDLLLEEVLGPATGLLADADPGHRQVVRITAEPEATEDPIYADTLIDGALQRRTVEPALPLLRVELRRQDRLAFPVCLSRRTDAGDLLRNVTIARGNLVLADHGITTQDIPFEPHEPIAGDLAFRLPLLRGPLTQQCQPETVAYDPVAATITSDRRDLGCSEHEARPAVAMLATFPIGTELWTPVPDLLDSPSFAQQFVAEVDNDGRATLRFGDGEYGREVAGATALQPVYRIGNGTAGNVGAGTLAHLALPAPAAFVVSVRNPIAATGGVDPETVEEVRRFAPQAFHAEQFRAVTEEDYRLAAEKLDEVAGAVASFRWTGSWLTVFVGIDPADPEDLIQEGAGLARLAPELERRVRAFLSRVRLAGYDLEIRPPRFVPLELDLRLCVAPDHFRSEVAQAVEEALSNRISGSGKRGFFHPDNFTFGQPVYLSQIYAAVERVEGVDSLVVTRFRRYGELDNGELLAGVLETGPWEIARLDNDPSFRENGVLRIESLGGKG